MERSNVSAEKQPAQTRADDLHADTAATAARAAAKWSCVGSARDMLRTTAGASSPSIASTCDTTDVAGLCTRVALFDGDRPLAAAVIPALSSSMGSKYLYQSCLTTHATHPGSGTSERRTQRIEVAAGVRQLVAVAEATTPAELARGPFFRHR